MKDFGTYGNQVEFAKVSLNESAEPVSLQKQDTVFQTLTVQDSVVFKTDTIPVKPSYEQIRYWHWQREKKMLINDSRYIPSKSGNELILFEEIEHSGLKLPVREKHFFSNDWVTIILLAALLLIASVRFGYAKYIGSLFQSVVNYPTAIRMFGEKNYSILHGAFRLEALYYIVLSVFIYQFLVFFTLKSTNNDMVFYAKTFVVITAYFLLKKFVYKMLGTIFLVVSETAEFIFNMDNYNRVTGIILLPIVALIAFYPSGNPVFIILLGIFAAGVFYIMLLKRGISILMKKQFSIFYLFLYLCILEFLPLLLIYKVVVD